MITPIYIVASLWIHHGAESAFQTYELKAANIMKKYGGNIERTVRPSAPGQPFEIHIIRFPGLEMFEAYRADPDLKTLSADRHLAISKTEIVIGNEGPAY